MDGCCLIVLCFVFCIWRCCGREGKVGNREEGVEVGGRGEEGRKRGGRGGEKMKGEERKGEEKIGEGRESRR